MKPTESPDRRSASILLVLSGLAGGIALTVACTDGPNMADAQTSHAMDPAAYAERVYQVHVRGELPGAEDRTIQATASCASGDVLLGGGCWAYVGAYGPAGTIDDAGRDYVAFINGPEVSFNVDGEYGGDIPPTWRCAYKNFYQGQNVGVRAHAHAICFRTGN